MFHSLLVINKAGGLIFQRDYTEGYIQRLSTNEYLVLAGTFHSVHVITSKLSPAPTNTGSLKAIIPGGLELIESDMFNMHCFQTPTGIKFLMITDPQQTQQQIDAISKKIYDIYSDYVMKNPFYTPEMPIRAELFELQMQKLCKSLNG